MFKQPYERQGVECGGLNTLDLGSDTIERCGLDEVGVALLEEVCHCGGLTLRAFSYLPEDAGTRCRRPVNFGFYFSSFHVHVCISNRASCALSPVSRKSSTTVMFCVRDR